MSDHSTGTELGLLSYWGSIVSGGSDIIMIIMSIMSLIMRKNVNLSVGVLINPIHLQISGDVSMMIIIKIIIMIIVNLMSMLVRSGLIVRKGKVINRKSLLSVLWGIVEWLVISIRG